MMLLVKVSEPENKTTAWAPVGLLSLIVLFITVKSVDEIANALALLEVDRLPVISTLVRFTIPSSEVMAAP